MIDLASDSEDEKKIGKAKAAAEKKRKEAKTNSGNTSKKFKSPSDFQLFRGKTTLNFLLCEVLGLFGWTAWASNHQFVVFIYLWF